MKIVEMKKGVGRALAAGEVREATTGRVVRLERVWAVAEGAAAAVPELLDGPPIEPKTLDEWGTQAGCDRVRKPVEVAFYRKYTEALLRRYERMSRQHGRVGSVLGRELFRAEVSHYTTQGFDDGVIFCVDVEACLKRLQPMERRLLVRVAMQGYKHGEAALLLGVSLRHVLQRYHEAVDKLTTRFLEVGILRVQKTCQEGEGVEMVSNV